MTDKWPWRCQAKTAYSGGRTRCMRLHEWGTLTCWQHMTKAERSEMTLVERRLAEIAGAVSRDEGEG